MTGQGRAPIPDAVIVMRDARSRLNHVSGRTPLSPADAWRSVISSSGKFPIVPGLIDLATAAIEDPGAGDAGTEPRGHERH